MKALVVISPFGGYGVGEKITDASEIHETLAGEHSRHVVAADHEITMAGESADETPQEA